MTEPPPPLRLRFRVEGEERSFELAAPEISIGRGLDNDLVLPDPSVSRHHAAILRGDRSGDGVWTVRDLGSTNGIAVNGEELTEAPLAVGDTLRVGTVEMAVESATEAPVSPLGGEEETEELASATIVRRLADLPPGFLSAGSGPVPVEEGKRRALEEAYSNQVFGYLTRLAGSLLTTDSLPQVLRQVMDVAFEALPVDRGFIFLRPTSDGDDDGTVDVDLECELARHGDEVEVRPAMELPVSRTMLRTVIQRQVALVTPNAMDDQRLQGSDSVMLHNVRSALAAPLWSGQRIVGVLLLDSRGQSGTFTEQDVELATALSNFAAVAIERIRYAERAEHERRMRSRLERYHSPAVIGEVLSDARAGRLGLKEAEVTVLFADVVGFSTFAEGAPPEEVAALLDGFFHRAVEAIFEAGGTLDKFIGDCVMAFFGAPVPQDDHARRAVDAAVAIRRSLAEWNELRRASGRLPVEIRIALNSGPVVVGEVGSDRRVDYTVLGNTVNVAARLEDYAARPGDVVLSGATLERLGDGVDVEELGELPLAGLKQAVAAYRLVEETA